MSSVVLALAEAGSAVGAASAFSVVVARRPRARRERPQTPATFAERLEADRLSRVRELYAADKIDTAELERATARVVRGLEPFPPVEQPRPRTVLEAHANAFTAAIRAANPAADDAARIAADREARRADRERKRWRH